MAASVWAAPSTRTRTRAGLPRERRVRNDSIGICPGSGGSGSSTVPPAPGDTGENRDGSADTRTVSGGSGSRNDTSRGPGSIDSSCQRAAPRKAR